MATEQQR
jgi:hypothetical protein